MSVKKYSNRKRREDSRNNNGVTGVVLIIISVFFLLCFAFSSFTIIGLYIRKLIIGLIGLSAYPMFVSMLILGIALLQSRKLILSKKNLVSIVTIGACLIFLLQLITTQKYMTGQFSDYVDGVYSNSTVGGVVFGAIIYGISLAITTSATYVFLGLIMAILLILLFLDVFGNMTAKSKTHAATPRTKSFVKGFGPSNLMHTVNNNGLFVDTIRHEPADHSVQQLSSVQQPSIITQEGRFDDISQPKKPQTLSKYTNKYDFLAYNKDIEDSAKNEAHRILFGGSFEERAKNDVNSGDYDCQKNIYEKLSYNSIPQPKESLESQSSLDLQKQKDANSVKKQKEDSSSIAAKYGLRELAVPPSKDVSANYVQGAILNGDQLSEELRKYLSSASKPTQSAPFVAHNDTTNLGLAASNTNVAGFSSSNMYNAGQSNSNANSNSPYQATNNVSQNGIINGDYYTKRQPSFTQSYYGQPQQFDNQIQSQSGSPLQSQYNNPSQAHLGKIPPQPENRPQVVDNAGDSDLSRVESSFEALLRADRAITRSENDAAFVDNNTLNDRPIINGERPYSNSFDNKSSSSNSSSIENQYPKSANAEGQYQSSTNGSRYSPIDSEKNSKPASNEGVFSKKDKIFSDNGNSYSDPAAIFSSLYSDDDYYEPFQRENDADKSIDNKFTGQTTSNEDTQSDINACRQENPARKAIEDSFRGQEEINADEKRYNLQESVGISESQYGFCENLYNNKAESVLNDRANNDQHQALGQTIDPLPSSDTPQQTAGTKLENQTEVKNGEQPFAVLNGEILPDNNYGNHLSLHSNDEYLQKNPFDLANNQSLLKPTGVDSFATNPFAMQNNFSSQGLGNSTDNANSSFVESEETEDLHDREAVDGQNLSAARDADGQNLSALQGLDGRNNDVGMRVLDGVIDKSETSFSEGYRTGYYTREGEEYDFSETESEPEEQIYDKSLGLEESFRDNVKEIERNLFAKDSKPKTASQINIDDYLKSASPIPEKPAPKRKKAYKYVPPPIDLLLDNSTDPSLYGGDCEKKAVILEETLKSLRFPSKVIGITKGPAVTRYEMETTPGIPIKRVESCAKDIAYALASDGKIRIETPIPGRRAVGVEVPNEMIATVCLRDIISSKEFISAPSALTLAIGKDITGNIITSNLEKMPHLLIAGATGTGKSVCLNSLITSILYKASPEDVRLILIDPKRVEFAVFKDMPHLLMKNIITEPPQIINAFKWAKAEMERRYKLFSSYVNKNIQEFNSSSAVKSGAETKMPYIVIIVDELSDLMMPHSNCRKELEDKIMSMAQKARAAGIHLILATQRPSVDVITGTIKANLPSRIAFAVTSVPDSRTVLDQGGAEALLGKGDMLYSPLDLSDPRRVQGAFITSEEVERVVEYVKQNNTFDFDEEAESTIMYTEEEGEQDEDAEESAFDPLMKDALRRVIETGQASTSMIQRRFSVGYARAARIMDQMEHHRFVGPSEGAKPREVYITREQFGAIFGEDI